MSRNNHKCIHYLIYLCHTLPGEINQSITNGAWPGADLLRRTWMFYISMSSFFHLSQHAFLNVVLEENGISIQKPFVLNHFINWYVNENDEPHMSCFSSYQLCNTCSLEFILTLLLFQPFHFVIFFFMIISGSITLSNQLWSSSQAPTNEQF